MRIEEFHSLLIWFPYSMYNKERHTAQHKMYCCRRCVPQGTLQLVQIYLLMLSIAACSACKRRALNALR